MSVSTVVPRHILVPGRRSVHPCQEEGRCSGVGQVPVLWAGQAASAPYGTVAMADLRVDHGKGSCEAMLPAWLGLC